MLLCHWAGRLGPRSPFTRYRGYQATTAAVAAPTRASCSCSSSIAVVAPTTLELAGRSVHLLCAMLADHTNLAGVDTGLVEPVDNGQPRCLLIGRTLSQVSSEGEVLMQVLNANPEPVKIHQGTRLGVFTPSHAICTVTEEALKPHCQSR